MLTIWLFIIFLKSPGFYRKVRTELLPKLFGDLSWEAFTSSPGTFPQAQQELGTMRRTKHCLFQMSFEY